MGENSKIEWCRHTFNPWIGCQKVSLGCDNCYAETLMATRYKRVQWGPHGERVRTSEDNWRKPYTWNRAAAAAGERPRVFCASLADWLDNKAPQEWRRALATMIADTPHLDWLLLTKRIENFAKLSPFGAAVPKNVWLGITAEDQFSFDRRWPILAEIPAKVRFVSYEPAIGPLWLGAYPGTLPDWIICGGESGHHPRVLDPAWALSLRDQCRELGVKFFMKQMTAKAPIPPALLIRQFPALATRR